MRQPLQATFWLRRPANRAYAYFPICSRIERKNAGFCGQTRPSM
jgi:hypothetical protein